MSEEKKTESPEETKETAEVFDPTKIQESDPEKLKKIVFDLQNENKKHRLSNKEKIESLESKLAEIDAKDKEKTKQEKEAKEAELAKKGETAELLKAKTDDYKSLEEKYNAIEKQNKALSTQINAIFEKKLELIKDNKLKQKLTESKDLELLELMLSNIAVTDNSLGTEKKNTDTQYDLSKMSPDEINELAGKNPDLYSKLQMEEFQKQKG